MTIDIAELFARRERERDAPPRQNPKIRHRTAVQTNFIPLAPEPDLPSESGFCVKSPSFNLRVEHLSQFRRCRDQLHWQLLSEDDN